MSELDADHSAEMEKTNASPAKHHKPESLLSVMVQSLTLLVFGATLLVFGYLVFSNEYNKKWVITEFGLPRSMLDTGYNPEFILDDAVSRAVWAIEQSEGSLLSDDGDVMVPDAKHRELVPICGFRPLSDPAESIRSALDQFPVVVANDNVEFRVANQQQSVADQARGIRKAIGLPVYEIQISVREEGTGFLATMINNESPENFRSSRFVQSPDELSQAIAELLLGATAPPMAVWMSVRDTEYTNSDDFLKTHHHAKAKLSVQEQKRRASLDVVTGLALLARTNSSGRYDFADPSLKLEARVAMARRIFSEVGSDHPDAAAYELITAMVTSPDLYTEELNALDPQQQIWVRAYGMPFSLADCFGDLECWVARWKADFRLDSRSAAKHAAAWIWTFTEMEKEGKSLPQSFWDEAEHQSNSNLLNEDWLLALAASNRGFLYPTDQEPLEDQITTQVSSLLLHDPNDQFGVRARAGYRGKNFPQLPNEPGWQCYQLAATRQVLEMVLDDISSWPFLVDRESATWHSGVHPISYFVSDGAHTGERHLWALLMAHSPQRLEQATQSIIQLLKRVPADSRGFIELTRDAMRVLNAAGRPDLARQVYEMYDPNESIFVFADDPLVIEMHRAAAQSSPEDLK